MVTETKADGPFEVLVADSHLLFAESLATSLRHHHGLGTLDEYATSTQATLEAISKYQPTVLLVDYWLPDSGAVELLEQLRVAFPDLRSLVLSWSPSESSINDSLRAGAVGFLPKGLSVSQVAEAVVRANNGELPVFAEQLDDLLERLKSRRAKKSDARHQARLTPRENDVLELVGRGMVIEDVGKQMSITRGTAYLHLHNAMRKLGANSYQEAVAKAFRQGAVGQGRLIQASWANSEGLELPE